MLDCRKTSKRMPDITVETTETGLKTVAKKRLVKMTEFDFVG